MVFTFFLKLLFHRHLSVLANIYFFELFISQQFKRNVLFAHEISPSEIFAKTATISARFFFIDGWLYTGEKELSSAGCLKYSHGERNKLVATLQK